MQIDPVPAKRPSLRMLRPSLDDLPSLEAALARLPHGYHLRTYHPGDEPALTDIMNTGQMGTWDVARTRAELTDCPYPQFDPQGMFFITTGSEQRPVGTACAWLLDRSETRSGELHRVCVDPEHRGHRLSYVLCLAVLHRFRQRGFQRTLLTTHDWRLGAIKIYLELGFRPVYQDPLHPTQWQEVRQALAWPHPIEPIQDDASPCLSGE